MTVVRRDTVAALALDLAEVPDQVVGSMPAHPASRARAPARSSDRRGQRSPLGLGPLETAIMQATWEADDWLMIREIRDRMNYPSVAHTTVARVAQILYGKGLLRRDLIERAGRPGPSVWYYRAARSATEHIGELIAALLDHSPSPAESLGYALSTAQAAIQLESIVQIDRIHEHRIDARSAR
jgi:predicted transcriptional regulator